MCGIVKKIYGYKLIFDGLIKADEMKAWVDKSRKILSLSPSKFGVFVDMRTLKPLAKDSQQFMKEGQKLYKEKGMVRSAVVLDSAVTKMQFQRIAKETGIYEWERYIDASSVSDWEQVGIDWISKGVDPDN